MCICLVKQCTVPVHSDTVPVHSDKDPVKAIGNNNYVKYDSGIKEESCSHTPIVTRTSKSHSEGMNNERQ
jgi:hypothetical protein